MYEIFLLEDMNKNRERTILNKSDLILRCIFSWVITAYSKFLENWQNETQFLKKYYTVIGFIFFLAIGLTSSIVKFIYLFDAQSSTQKTPLLQYLNYNADPLVDWAERIWLIQKWMMSFHGWRLQK